MNKTIWLIRHGESEANIGLSTSIPGTIPLTELGRAQAAKVSEYFTALPSLVVVSPYLRTQQTAAPLIKRLNINEVETWPVQEFTYLDLEQCRNTTFSERLPLVNAYWQRNAADYRDSYEVESFADFINRAKEMIHRLRFSNHQFTAVFTHGLFIKLIMWLLLTGVPEISENSMKEYYKFNLSVIIPNCGIVKLNLTESENYVSNIISL